MADEAITETEWEYGFYDSAPDGDWKSEPRPQESPQIWWYVFGSMTHTTPESARRTGSKSVNGHAVIVRRRGQGHLWELHDSLHAECRSDRSGAVPIIEMIIEDDRITENISVSGENFGEMLEEFYIETIRKTGDEGVTITLQDRDVIWRLPLTSWDKETLLAAARLPKADAAADSRVTELEAALATYEVENSRMAKIIDEDLLVVIENVLGLTNTLKKIREDVLRG